MLLYGTVYQIYRTRERAFIEKGIIERRSIRALARSIGRYPSAVSKEKSRNGGKQRYYAAKAHHERAISNKTGYSKIRNNPRLENYIRDKLKEGWSSEVIAGRWNMENSSTKITHETLYT